MHTCARECHSHSTVKVFLARAKYLPMHEQRAGEKRSPKRVGAAKEFRCTRSYKRTHSHALRTTTYKSTPSMHTSVCAKLLNTHMGSSLFSARDGCLIARWGETVAEWPLLTVQCSRAACIFLSLAASLLPATTARTALLHALSADTLHTVASIGAFLPSATNIEL